MGQNATRQLDEQIRDLEMTTRSLKRNAEKALDDRDTAIETLKERREEMRRNNDVDADLITILATNVIRYKQQHTSLVRLASKLEGFGVRMKQLSNTLDATNRLSSITKVTSRLFSANGVLNVERLEETMGKLDKALDDLSVVEATLTAQLDSTSASTADAGAVTELLKRMDEEEAMREDAALPSAPSDVQGPARTAVNDDPDDARLIKEFDELYT